jgi:hypothetical protein
MLYSFDPLSLIHTTISPAHLAMAVALILPVLPLVPIAARPREHPIAVLLVQAVVALVLVGLRAFAGFPLALAMFHAILELANIKRPILPSILPLAIRFAFLVVACVDVAVGEDVRALAVLQAVLPLTFVAVAVLPDVHAVAFCF